MTLWNDQDEGLPRIALAGLNRMEQERLRAALEGVRSFSKASGVASSWDRRCRGAAAD
jgi:hypothetical protein